PATEPRSHRRPIGALCLTVRPPYRAAKMRSRMRRNALIAGVLAGALWLCPTAPVGAQSGTLPQAFLLGAWTGGLFPTPGVLSAGQCLAQPTIIFTRDLVLRASLTDQYYTQRLIETARGTGTGVDFRFSPAPSGGPQTALAGPVGGDGGFGCEDPDVLHVRRISPNEIRFPGCREFPFPLIRCPAG
ncbi:MAG: hypothetical protein ACRDOD_22870, partial [Streptosporangiaceae bacterium]